MRRKQERRKQRRATDVEYRARQRQVNREWAKRRFEELQCDPAKWTAWRLQHWWLPRWLKLLDASPEEIRRYIIRARPDARREFVKWYSRQRLIDTASGLGRIPTPLDEIVPETSTKKK